MDEDRQVAWMRATLPHKLVTHESYGLRLVIYGAIAVYAVRKDSNTVTFNSLVYGSWAVESYTHDFGAVMSGLVAIIALRYKPARLLR